MKARWRAAAVAPLLVVAASPEAARAAREPRGALVFDCDDGPAQDLCRGHIDSGRVWRLTETRAWESEPTWAPDGSRIAFSLHKRRSGSHTQIYLMSADGTDAERLPQKRRRNNEQPAWSPSGKWLAFVSETTCKNASVSNFDIWVMRPDGSDKRRLTTGCFDELEPEWSPDGRRIAFQSVGPGNPEIFVMRSDGSRMRRITTHDSIDGNVAWSPDGTSIAFASTRTGEYQVFVRRLQAAKARRLTGGDANNLMPSWSPSGKRIAFVSDRRGSLQLFLMSRRGRHERRLFPGGEYERPEWRPRG